jgi:uncharacterized protein YcbK (DUF882 family)
LSDGAVLFRLAVIAIAIQLISGGATAAPQKSSAASKTDQGKTAKKTKKASRYAAVELYQINTKETLKLRFYDDHGRPIKGWQKRFERFMRCHLTNTTHKMDGRLAQMLYKTARSFEGHRMEVVSGYRSPKVARNPKSPHKEGLACDFRMAGVANTVLRDYLRKTFDHAGVGYYPNSVFVHLDNRKQGPSAFWIDYSGPGQEASYAENPREDLRNGRAERRRGGEGSEGEDDMAQAGLAGTMPRAGNGASNGRKVAPIEVKPTSDPFGD